MNDGSKSLSRWWLAAAVAVMGFVLFQWFGNATRGYIDTRSVFYWWTYQWWNPASETQHGWLILAISVWLLWRNLRNAECGVRTAECGNPQSAIANSQWPAFAAMAAGLALHAVGFVAQQTRVSIVAFLIFAWGVLRLGGGKRWGDAARFPLGFLVFAIPLNVLDSLGFWLRLWVIDAAEMIAHLAHIEVVRSGTQLFAADGRYQYDVAAACSGVRSLMALAALSLLVGYLNFHSTGRRALMFVLCFPLTYLGNVARIAAIIFAAQLGGQTWGERAHDVMGFGVFVIVLGGVLAAARVLQTRFPEKRSLEKCNAMRYTVRGGAKRSRVVGIGAVATGGIVMLAVGEMIFLGRLAERPGDGAAGVRLTPDGANPIELPAFVGTEWIGRRAEVTAVEREILPEDTGFSRRNYVQVQGGAHAVFVSIVLSGRDRTSIHRPELCLVGQGWTIAASGERRLRLGEALSVPVTLLSMERREPRTGQRVPSIVAYWFVSSGELESSHWRRALRDMWSRLRHGRADRWAYVLVQADAADGEAAALARMEEVLRAVVPTFQLTR